MGVGNVFEDNVTKNYQKFSFIKKCKQYQYFNKSWKDTITLHLLIIFSLQYSLYKQYAKNCG